MARAVFSSSQIAPLKSSRSGGFDAGGRETDLVLVAPPGYNGIGLATMAPWGYSYGTDGNYYYKAYKGGDVSLPDPKGGGDSKAQFDRVFRELRARDVRLFNDDVAEYEKAKAERTRKRRQEESDQRDQLRAGAAQIQAEQEARAEAFRRASGGTGGEVSNQVASTIINGLDLEQFTPDIIAILGPSDQVSFDVVQENGVTLYLDAILIPGGDPSAIVDTNKKAMNHPTAVYHAFQGVPIGRLSTAPAGSQVPSVWFTYEAGVWYYNTAEVRRVVQVGDLTVADHYATDWTTPPNCPQLAIAVRPGYPVGETTASPGGPLWNVNNPPCRVWDPAA